MEKPVLLFSKTVRTEAVPLITTDLPVVDVLGVPVACADREALLQFATRGALQSSATTILYVNAHCLNLAARDRMYHRLLNRANLVYSDGISVVWAGKLLARARLTKVTGADWIFDFCEYAVRYGLRLYILAGKPGIAAQAKKRMQSQFPGLQITGTADGYFQEKSEAEVLEELAQTQPHILLVGMGTPLQEKWIFAHRKAMNIPVCWAVGALFDYVSGVEPRAPAWINKLAMEWFWRLLVDPLGKWKRYLFGNPLFIYRVVRQKWTQTFSKGQ